MSAKKCLEDCATTFTKNVNVEIIISHLIKHRLITDPQRQALMLSTQTDHKKTQLLLDNLLCKVDNNTGHDQLHLFMLCLRSTKEDHPGHKTLLDELSSQTTVGTHNRRSPTTEPTAQPTTRPTHPPATTQPPTNKPQEYKVILIGSANVGKTGVIKRFCDGSFTHGYCVTIGLDVSSKIIHSDRNTIKLMIWDTAGQEKFRALTRNYYRDAHAVAIVFDVGDKETFQSISMWIQDVEKYCEEGVQKIVVGNKYDCVKREVTTEEASAFAANQEIPYMETSAVTGHNIDELFHQLAQTVYQAPPAMSQKGPTSHELAQPAINQTESSLERNNIVTLHQKIEVTKTKCPCTIL